MVKTKEFQGVGVSENLNYFIKNNEISRENLIDIKYTVRGDTNYYSALIIYETE